MQAGDRKTTTVLMEPVLCAKVVQNDEKGARMDFDYTAYEYLPECTAGCGAITDWLSSKEAAREAGENHAGKSGHSWRITERMRESPL